MGILTKGMKWAIVIQKGLLHKCSGWPWFKNQLRSIFFSRPCGRTSAAPIWGRWWGWRRRRRPSCRTDSHLSGPWLISESDPTVGIPSCLIQLKEGWRERWRSRGRFLWFDLEKIGRKRRRRQVSPYLVCGPLDMNPISATILSRFFKFLNGPEHHLHPLVLTWA